MTFATATKRRAVDGVYLVEITRGSTYRYTSGPAATLLTYDWTPYPINVSRITSGVGENAGCVVSVADKDWAWTAIIDGCSCIDFPVKVWLVYDDDPQLIFDGSALSVSRQDGWIVIEARGALAEMRQSPRLYFRSPYANVSRGTTVKIGNEIYVFQ